MLITHILQDCFSGTGAILRLPRYQLSKPEEYRLIRHTNPLNDALTTTKQRTTDVCILYGMYCIQAWDKQTPYHHNYAEYTHVYSSRCRSKLKLKTWIDIITMSFAGTRLLIETMRKISANLKQGITDSTFLALPSTQPDTTAINSTRYHNAICKENS